MKDKCPYNCCFLGYCFQDLFMTEGSIFVYFPSSFLSKCFIKVHMVQPYSSTDTVFLSLSLSLYIYIYIYIYNLCFTLLVKQWRLQKSGEYLLTPSTHVYIYIYICAHVYVYIWICSLMGVEHCGKGIYGCHSHNAKLVKWIEDFGIQ